MIAIKIGNPLGVDGLVRGVQQILEQPQLVGAKCVALIVIQSVQLCLAHFL